MTSFKDAAGREWRLEINVDTIKRVRGSTLKVNLLDVVDRKSALLGQLAEDPVFLVDLLFVLCQPQAEKENVSDVVFGQAMAGDVIEQATTALLEEIANFFPAGKRQILMKMLEKIKAIETQVNQKAQQKLDSPELEQLIQKELDALFGSLPESSEPAPDHTRSAS